MALTNDDLRAISDLIQPIRDDLQGVKDDLRGVKGDVQGLKEDMQEVKGELAAVKMHLENVTDKNIQLLAENHIALVDKLRQTTQVGDRNISYEVKVDYAIEEINKLKKDVAMLMSKTA